MGDIFGRAYRARKVATARRTLVDDGAVGAAPKPKRATQYEIWLHPLPQQRGDTFAWMLTGRKPWRVGKYARQSDADKALTHYKSHPYYSKYYTAVLLPKG